MEEEAREEKGKAAEGGVGCGMCLAWGFGLKHRADMWELAGLGRSRRLRLHPSSGL
jgi:hypothetical protein